MLSGLSWACPAPRRAPKNVSRVALPEYTPVMNAVARSTTAASGTATQTTSRMASLLKNPASGQIPTSESTPTTHTANVTGISRRSPPISRMSCVPAPWITLPEVRKSSALKAACVIRWKKANAQAPTPSAANMKPSWLMVEYASTFLMSRCGIAASAGPQRRDQPRGEQDRPRRRGRLEERPRPGDQEHARRDHRRRVDERRDRRRALHGVGQPDVERELRRLADGADREQHGSSREGRRSHRGQSGHHRHVAERLGRRPQHGQTEEQPDVADARRQERLDGSRHGRGLLVPESDEQVGARTDQLPPDEERGEGVAHDQQRHRAR